ncbi:MAG: hypothetical protein HY791_36340 [Deltaproteobacteria bacterium]|nr:hypothetical protein [Deltaproteobacteria bacterium]
MVPLFPQQSVEVLSDQVFRELTYAMTPNLHRRLHEPDMAVRWRVFADDMPPREGGRKLSELNDF